jgi:hypothetical protein
VNKARGNNGGIGLVEVGSTPIRRRGVAAALEVWLAEAPVSGGNAVRAQLARRLAAQVDDPGTAGYVLPRLAAELRQVLDDLADEAGEVDEVEAARRILRELA